VAHEPKPEHTVNEEPQPAASDGTTRILHGHKFFRNISAERRVRVEHPRAVRDSPDRERRGIGHDGVGVWSHANPPTASRVQMNPGLSASRRLPELLGHLCAAVDDDPALDPGAR